MPDKSLSRLVLPDPVLNAFRSVATAAWAIALAGWAVAICLVIAAALLTDLSSGLKGGIDGAFTNVPVLFLGGGATVIVATLIVRLTGARADKLSLSLFTLALGLFTLVGLLAVVLGVIGFFIAFTDGSFDAVFLSLCQHVGGFVLGIALISWAVGELAALSRVASSAPAGIGIASVDGKLVGPKEVAKFVPAPLLNRPELKSSWEIVVACVVLAALLFTVGATTEGVVVDLSVTVLFMLGGAPVLVAAITLVARLRSSDGSAIGRTCIDASLLLTLLLGLFLVLFAVIGFLKAFKDSGFGYVVGQMVWAVAAGVMGTLTAVWSLTELAVLRQLAPGMTLSLVDGVAWQAAGVPARPAATAPVPPAPPSAAPPPVTPYPPQPAPGAPGPAGAPGLVPYPSGAPGPVPYPSGPAYAQPPAPGASMPYAPPQYAPPQYAPPQYAPGPNVPPTPAPPGAPGTAPPGAPGTAPPGAPGAPGPGVQSP
ncbi:MAG TPA: hypothetical protein VME46_19580 [Acidimicrobiales bacterium]|nr:hypothetical protein [Acidimicrobiales bacterium]